MMAKTKSAPTPTMIRWNENDYKIVTALQKKLGVRIPELIRLGLRALATKEGVTA